MPESPPQPAYWLLGSRDFSFLASTRFLVTFGTQIQAVAVGWLVYQLKSDPLFLGYVGLMEAFPALGLALFAGWIVDRSRPRSVYRRALAGSALSALILCWVSSRFFIGGSQSRLAVIFLASFITGVARSFLSPSQFSILPLTVPRADLGKATAWNTSLNQIAALSGPALGGFFYAWVGGARTFASIFVLLVIALVAAGRLRQGGQRPAGVPTGRAAGFFSGVRFVFADQLILAAISLDMFGVLFGGATALFPIFARDVFANGPVGLGFLRAAMPVGSFLMGFFLIRVPISRFSGRIMLVAFAGFGLCMAGFGLSTSFPLSIALLLVTGMCDSISMVTRQTILQMSTPDAMRGRVASVSSIFIGSSNEVGAFESGLAAKLMGTRPSVVFGGCMTLVVVAVTWFLAPALRRVHLSRL
jgi:MFS family permease